MEWRVLTDEEVQQRRLQQEQEDKLQAEHDAAVETCLLKTMGKHQWQMTMYHPEDDVDVHLGCTQCPVTLEDLWQDSSYLVYVELDNGMQVEEGQVVNGDPGLLPAVVPVDVVLRSKVYSSPNGVEYDAEVEVTQRGPVRALDL